MSHNIQHCDLSLVQHEENHLCRIILRKDLGKIKELVKEAQYYCKNCGRAARLEENLCNPSKI